MLIGTVKGILPAFARIFHRRSLVWHGTAIALTALLVLSDTDWWFYEHTRSPLLHPIVWAAGLGGFFIPVLIPLGMYFVGEWRKDNRLMDIATTIAQAVIIGLLVSFLYKAFTGRIQPDFLGVGGTDISKEFQFGLLRHGVFWGWPSSHVAVASAGAAALVGTLRSRGVAIGAYLYVCVVAAGAAIGFHWFSDVIAGFLFGTLAGRSVVQTRKSSSDTITS